MKNNLKLHIYVILILPTKGVSLNVAKNIEWFISHIKPLLEIGRKPMVEHIINKIEELEEIDEIFIVTNDKFYQNFKDWKNDGLLS